VKTKRDEKIGYKVIVNCLGGHYESVAMFGIANVIYFVDKWVEPRMGNGPLAAFDTFEDAESFSVDTDMIFKCKYIPSKEKKLWYRGVGGRLFAKGDFPTGTVLADKVMLLEEIKNENQKG
jgi:hypothetical protein